MLDSLSGYPTQLKSVLEESLWIHKTIECNLVMVDSSPANSNKSSEQEEMP
jgi:hypothetical protein